ncbi:hypothetical protein I3760_01G160400 [Carya illinoinensis]|uniref:Phytocyanin domain-containing protein n=1 Tax=Carya illinoinensis TaxID=32201 RepID=A0A8T1RNW6_CARIL|nr:mavicyanin-like [Carya illinoinensis]KAG2727510.1 hypothetical protein I3760_01G160400 [Carya illinoinensis]KAG6668355.1 hypothetical protein CIPAW_01G164200 [Carya illinoinensis]KAG6732147.1 hypothetical protein I3842_01G162900 [Carya illinoinensis]
MSLLERAVVVLMVMAVLHFSDAAVHKVGDSAGWTTIGNVDYKQWAAAKTFRVGDIIIFKYNAQFHNVMRVTHAMYRTCNVSTPLDTFTTGNDSITITSKGHHFFFCGVPGHCQAGQKVDINVMPHNHLTAPTPFASVSPLAPAIGVPVPSPSKAAPLNVLEGGFDLLGLAMAFIAPFVCGFA